MLGADLVVYSATKYLSGFSDMLPARCWRGMRR
jgi:cystathionine beta-lyase/cystathionine gamma-synthase